MGIKIYHRDTLLAEERGGIFYPINNIPAWKLPFVMFKGKSDPVGLMEFEQWIEDRVVPENRTDLGKVLDDLNLCTYDMWAIAKLTQCRKLPDKYWVDFGNFENPLPKRKETEKDVKEREEMFQEIHRLYYKE